jgi:tripartite-type tricarboxylate transporter receptor subunit TctC
MKPRRRLILAAAVLAASRAEVGAQPAVTRPIRLLVPFGAGGPTDLLARAVATRLAETLGQPVVVENRPGAAGRIAADALVRAAPDGFTLMVVTSGTQTINPALYSKLGYRPLQDFSYLSTLGSYSLVMVANPRLEARSVGELVRLARAQPDALSYGSAGSGASGHLASELFKSAAGVRIRHVPYKSSAEALLGVASGDLAFVFDLLSTAMPQIQAGRVRALAWSGPARTALLPDVPTFAEAGVPGFEVTGWIGLAGPAGLPRAQVDRLMAGLRSVLASPELTAAMQAQGYDIAATTPEAFAETVKQDIEICARVVREARIEAD